MNSRASWRKVAIHAAVGGMLLSQTIAPFNVLSDPPKLYAAQTQVQETFTKVSEQPITSGAMLQQYVWNLKRSDEMVQVKANVVQIDLLNPYVKLDVMNGKNGQIAQKDTVLNMTKYSGAVAGVNGDYFNVSAEGSPLGCNRQVLLSRFR
ncbi:hypothetical protein [Marinicrinis lubricantis]|uniref:Uncharacterized protein n=1 Tax=Marinicrinis lubricantis TaxID=2086470 RepID=A0ABW1IKH6_9BACL